MSHRKSSVVCGGGGGRLLGSPAQDAFLFSCFNTPIRYVLVQDKGNIKQGAAACARVTFKKHFSESEKKLFQSSEHILLSPKLRLSKAVCSISSQLHKKKMKFYQPFTRNRVIYDWLLFAWWVFHPAQRSLAYVALGKMSPDVKWLRRFFVFLVVFSQGQPGE